MGINQSAAVGQFRAAVQAVEASLAKLSDVELAASEAEKRRDDLLAAEQAQRDRVKNAQAEADAKVAAATGDVVAKTQYARKTLTDLEAQRDALRAEVDGLRQERDKLQRERDQLVAAHNDFVDRITRKAG
jgi:chromosome segregation ATPase